MTFAKCYSLAGIRNSGKTDARGFSNVQITHYRQSRNYQLAGQCELRGDDNCVIAHPRHTVTLAAPPRNQGNCTKKTDTRKQTVRDYGSD